MTKKLTLYIVALAGILTLAVFGSYKEKEEELPKIDNSSREVLSQRVESVTLFKSFDLAGEVIPTKIPDIRERLERELLRNAYYHSSTVMNIKRSRRFFPKIEQILAEEGVPQDFKFLAVAESDLTQATSPAGAKGIWQFMRGTGKEYGLEVNNDIDERMHFEKSTRAACKYLKKLHARFGSWTMAAAAYNMGGSRLKKESIAQKSKYYYDLNLNQETSRYVFRIAALKELMTNPETYGYYLEPQDYYQEMTDYSTIEQTTTVENLGDFASKYGISYRQLKVYNPWMKSTRLPNASGKRYEIKIPNNKY